MSAAPEAIRQEHLFHIDRSKNANVVQYDVHLTSAGTPDPESPVVAYWRRPDGSRHDLKFYQRPAYGFDATCEYGCAEISIEMDADIGRKIRAVNVAGRWRATTTIDGQLCYLDKVFVMSQERFLLPPKVLYIDFAGTEVGSGEIRTERFTGK